MFVACKCGRILRMSEYKILKILRSLGLSETIANDWHHVMFLSHCPGCNGKHAPPASVRVSQFKERRVDELTYLEKVRAYKNMMEGVDVSNESNESLLGTVEGRKTVNLERTTITS